MVVAVSYLKLIIMAFFIIIKLLSASGIDPIEVSLEGSLLHSKPTIRGKVIRLVVVHVSYIFKFGNS